jgi:signal transduction histidine kinase
VYDLSETAPTLATDAQLESGERDERLFSLCHALQTPLSVVLMQSEMLLARPADLSAVERGLHNICGAARMQAAIIDNVVEWGRIVDGAPEMVPVAVDLACCVEDVLDRFAHQVRERRLTTRAGIEPGDWTVKGDPARLTLAVHNLVANAVKFTPSGGTVDVSLERGRHTVSLRVSDTGDGFSAEDAAGLFQRRPMVATYASHRSRSLGLGLRVAGWIALIHGGTISASSAGPSKGSSFVFTIPAGAADERPPK